MTLGANFSILVGQILKKLWIRDKQTIFYTLTNFYQNLYDRNLKYKVFSNPTMQAFSYYLPVFEFQGATLGANFSILKGPILKKMGIRDKLTVLYTLTKFYQNHWVYTSNIRFFRIARRKNSPIIYQFLNFGERL